MVFPVVDVSDWEPARPEAVGREEKVWLRPPDTPDGTRENDWLFKPVVVPANGNRQGEDWAEKLVAELGAVLGVPCARVETAVRAGRSGSISRNVAPDGWSLVLGSVLLSARDADYVEGELRPPGRPGHSPGRILEALRGCDPPPGTFGLEARTAFVGFLLLDAWVGNQDRHDQNWAVLRRTAGSGRTRLASSFDHASSLGFNLLDSRRSAVLRNGVSGFAAAARAHRFEHPPGAKRSECRPSSTSPVRPSRWNPARPSGGRDSKPYPSSMSMRWLPRFRDCRTRPLRSCVRCSGSTGRGCSMSAEARRSTSTAAVRSAPDAGRSSGALIVAWQHPESRLISPVGRLEHGPGIGYRFRYLRTAPSVEGFQQFLSFPEWDRDYQSGRLFPLFSQRIMSPRRSDFPEFLRQLHLDSNATPWEQLARSEGRRTGDTVQVFPVPSVEPDGSSSCFFLAHGIRHVTGGALPPVDPGEPLELRAEPHNPVNPDAQLLRTRGGIVLGYVPDLLLEHLAVLCATGPITMRVEHVNGVEAPAHLRLLVRLDGEAPHGYVPMSGGRWRLWAED